MQNHTQQWVLLSSYFLIVLEIEINNIYRGHFYNSYWILRNSQERDFYLKGVLTIEGVRIWPVRGGDLEGAHQFPRIISLGWMLGNHSPTGNILMSLVHLPPSILQACPFDRNKLPNIRNHYVRQTDTQSHLSCSKQCCSRLQVNSCQLSSLKDKE